MLASQLSFPLIHDNKENLRDRLVYPLIFFFLKTPKNN